MYSSLFMKWCARLVALHRGGQCLEKVVFTTNAERKIKSIEILKKSTHTQNIIGNVYHAFLVLYAYYRIK